MADYKQTTIRAIAGTLGLVLSVLFSVAVAATRSRVPTALAHCAPNVDAQQ